MKWMKFTDFEGDTVWLNMALAERFYAVTERTKKDDVIAVKTGARIVFGNDCGISVSDTPEHIIFRGEWLVK